jgi:predicted N-acyltransferase
MTSGAAAPGHGPSQDLRLTCRHHPAIEPVAAAWDHFVPRDLPHLRAGFLRAAERSGMIRRPDYLLLERDSHTVAAAVTFTLFVDAARTAPPHRQAWIAHVRRWQPDYGYRPLRVCGSPIGNGECGVYFAPDLPAAERRAVFRTIAEEVLRTGGLGPTYFFKEFPDEAVAEYASQLEGLGFFPVDPGPGTRMHIRWATFDEYVNAMRARYRKQLRKDLQVGAGLEFSLLDSFAELAPQATALYKNVVAHAATTLQVADEKFFAAVSEFEQAHLLVARLRDTGDLVGVQLLLFGDRCMHNVYIGFDYERNKQHRIYFNLFEESVRLAIARQCRVAYFGQTSYDFKGRMGAAPFALTAYMKHRLGRVHAGLLAAKDYIFPRTEVDAPSDIFNDEAGPVG